ncbi:MAG: hypothetical protein GWN32_09525, partial [Gemmatimonadetes bacterium]|nr:hypothetical protein [Gemmatimonadota bacterium]
GIRVLGTYITGFWSWGTTRISQGAALFNEYTGGIYLSTPSASPALLGVGYIIGPRLAA